MINLTPPEVLSWLQVIVLSIVQGITEFLPISSSGHLVLVPLLTNWPDQGVAFDIALHLGTLLAVLLYFWRDTGTLMSGAGRLIIFQHQHQHARLALNVAIATIPIILLALLLKDFVAAGARSFLVLGITSIVFGLALGIADSRPNLFRPLYLGAFLAKIWPDWLSPRLYRETAEKLLSAAREEGLKPPAYTDLSKFNIWHALGFGIFQALAIIPGTSRSGVCMTVGRMLGYDRATASRIAILLAIPTILLAVGFSLLFRLNDYQTVEISLGQFAAGLGISFVTAWLAIAALMALVNKIGFWPFVFYRLGLGAMFITLAFF